MIGISKLYMGGVEPSDALRYGRDSSKLPSRLLQFSADKKPVVVWNCTRACNLRCRHCYASCTDGCAAPDELTTAEARTMIADLAAFKAPVILFSGGEPLMRPDLDELIAHAVSLGMRAVISTNGTLITRGRAEVLKNLGLSYVGISLDGLEAAHNALRRSDTAFERALQGIANCLDAGMKVGVRLTLHKENASEIPAIFALLKERHIPRACFYHFVNCGTGSGAESLLLSREESRAVVDTVISETRKLHESGFPAEILTVDNHCDGIYLYLRMLKEGSPHAEDVLKLLGMNGGNGSGHAIGCISWDGSVYPDQFWRTRLLGNVREKAFSQIWSNPEDAFLQSLRHKADFVTGRCARCAYLKLCGGNFRARAEGNTGELWGEDPACYLSEAEISGNS